MENEKIITLQFRLTRRNALLILAGFFLCWQPRSLGSEQLTLTTYYPAPYGGYASLLTTGQTLMARDNGMVGVGTADPGRKLDVRFTDTATGRLVDVGNTDGSFGGLSIGNNGVRNYVGFNGSAGADDMVIDAQGNVGLGTTDPNPPSALLSSYKLNVVGNASVSLGGGQTGNLNTARNVFVGYTALGPNPLASATSAVSAGAGEGDLYVNGSILGMCEEVNYFVNAGGTSCPSEHRVFAVRGIVGGGRCNSGDGQLFLGGDLEDPGRWTPHLDVNCSGIMLCCRIE